MFNRKLIDNMIWKMENKLMENFALKIAYTDS